MLFASNSGTSNDDKNDSLEKFDSQQRKFQLVQAFSLALQKFFKPYQDQFFTVIEQNNKVIANHSNTTYAQKVFQQKGFRYLHDMTQCFHKESNLHQIEVKEEVKSLSKDVEYLTLQVNKLSALIVCQNDCIDDPENG